MSFLSVRNIATPTREQQCSSNFVARVMRAITAMGVCTEAGTCLYSPNQVTRAFATAGLRDGVKCLYVLSCFRGLDESRELTLWAQVRLFHACCSEYCEMPSPI